MPWTLGMPLIDDNVSRRDTPFFFGPTPLEALSATVENVSFTAGVFFIRIMGPVLGFVIGGWANKWYVTLKRELHKLRIYFRTTLTRLVCTAPPGLGPTDPGWIGAWWLGYLIVSISLFIPSLVLIAFPRIDFKKAKKAANERIVVEEADATTSAQRGRSRGENKTVAHNVNAELKGMCSL